MSGWWRTGAAVAALVAALSSSACEHDAVATEAETAPSPPPSSATGNPWQAVAVPATAYDSWTATMTDVRPWSEEEVADLVARVDDAQAREWTATFDRDELPLELAHTPSHDRVRLYADDGWALEVHVAAESMLRPGEPVPMVVCQHGQYGPECVRVTGDETPGELTTLLGDYSDVLAPLAGSLVASQAPHLLDVRPTDPDHVYLARVNSPAGPLECVVGGPGTSASDLEGEPLSFASEAPTAYPPWCLDQRGLVLVSSDEETSLNALTAMTPVVDGDVAEYPAEISPRVP